MEIKLNGEAFDFDIRGFETTKELQLALLESLKAQNHLLVSCKINGIEELGKEAILDHKDISEICVQSFDLYVFQYEIINNFCKCIDDFIEECSDFAAFILWKEVDEIYTKYEGFSNKLSAILQSFYEICDYISIIHPVLGAKLEEISEKFQNNIEKIIDYSNETNLVKWSETIKISLSNTLMNIKDTFGRYKLC